MISTTHYENIIIKPIFIKDEKIFPYEGSWTDENIEGVKKISFESIFIDHVLRLHLGNELEIGGSISKKNHLELEKLSFEQMDKLIAIFEDTNDYPIKYGRSHLKFKLVKYSPVCGPLCECCHCLGCCGTANENYWNEEAEQM